MIKVKLEKNNDKEPILKLGIKEKDLNIYKFLKRSLMDSKKLTGIYNYEVPLRYFIPIFNNLPKENLLIDKNSILSYLEFSDDFDEKYYYTLTANAKYMRLWREENCPNIYKVSINIDSMSIEKEIAFQKVKLNI
ncbi:hypothetical protein [Clostridium gasigenes]|uniref:Uncharacterized protein n=2 Tax=Clostridium gasigenes TaxID=94869 RepID=A0A1H0NGL3_9CLOT|nr:hypothetical protein [Clostridium gasigenes]MBB6623952.1 hypothetical protein [Clostridium gasigenes]MBB6716056.1 hypothetical protein [Clostridium gasigenes]MBU3087504.1 hypothetical protein [Clostridium gasigenes]MBU3103114.1 hypothetical protein [Clostridium gasigenes]MBU3106761.1 hypothetical protein [Clostridium gasigenes]